MSILRVFMLILCGFLILLCGLVYREYTYFKKELATLLAIREEYQNYVLALKRMIADYQRPPTDDVAVEKKKITQLQQSRWLNRDGAYLKESALEFARKHDLYEAVAKLYNGDLPLVPRVTKTRIQRNKSVKKRKNTEAPPVSWWEQLTEEPVFSCPVTKGEFWISSRFGPRKKADGSWGFHHGIDLAAVRGTAVYAAGSGIVIEAGYTQGYGNTVLIGHNRKFKTRYAHLEKISVKVGAKVDMNTIIGKVGDTGSVRKRGSDASHLHFEVYVFGKRVNPLYFMS